MEKQKGFTDKAVLGGLDGFLERHFARVGRSPFPNPHPSYASMTQPQREKWLVQALATLEHAADQGATEAEGRPAGPGLKPARGSPPDVQAAFGPVRGAPPGLGAAPRAGPAAMVAAEPAPLKAAALGKGLDLPVTTVKGVAGPMAARLGKLGIATVRDLLYHFPRRYNDFSRVKTISRLLPGEEVTILVRVWDIAAQRLRPGFVRVEAAVGDDSGNMRVTWFNPYVAKQVRAQSQVILSGRVSTFRGFLEMQNPEYELADRADELIHTGRIVPAYPLTEGLFPKSVRRVVKAAVDHWAPAVTEFLPQDLRGRRGLLDLPQAIRQVHFPDSQQFLAEARRRLAYDELLLLQLGLQIQKLRWKETSPGVKLEPLPGLLEAFRASLPFPLTRGQEEALGQVLADVVSGRPMVRLLQGEVGSGKTVVALMALLVAIMAGYQGALMAPTEVLAEQHFRTVTSLLSNAGMPEGGALASPFPVAPTVRLLTSSTARAEKSKTLAGVAGGQVHLLVGTHAAIQDDVSFSRLGLAVIDEQHRFGVAQRLALRQKAQGYSPHILAMTATPIPRTLALTVYGDLDISTIGELPPGRQKVRTRWLRPTQREKAYDFMRGQVKQGRQAFIICPLIEESEGIEARAAQEEYRRLSRDIFPDLRLGLLHGRMKGQEKDRVMAEFRAGEMDILVSTAVVEVGIDIPNATVMLVEGAERFGLAQLHQFRGRVGRGEHPSYCLLLEGNPSEEGQERLKVIESTHDGFALAQADLDMRGPGQFLGTRQSGLPGLRIARLSDLRLVETARQDAQDLLSRDAALTEAGHVNLRRELERIWKNEGIDFN